MVNTKTVVAIVAAVVPLVCTKEMPVDMQLQAELYDSGVRHGEIIALKEVRDFSQVASFVTLDC